jgi:hypothetical protein
MWRNIPEDTILQDSLQFNECLWPECFQLKANVFVVQQIEGWSHGAE